MSLDFYLEDQGRYGPHELFSANITHNLGPMAKEAGLYMPLWRPDEMKPPAIRAGDLIFVLRDGLARLIKDSKALRAFEPDNGWGTHDTLVGFVKDVLAACEKWPEAFVRVWR